MHRFYYLFLSTCLLFTSCTQRADVSRKIAGEEDLAGLRVATIAGSCYDLSLSKRDDIDLQLYTFDADALQALVNGKVDVMVHDETILNSELQKEHGIKISGKGKDRFPTALMFRKDEADIVAAMDALLDRIRQDGSMDRLKKYWLSEEYLIEKKYTHIPVEESGELLRIACVTNMAPLSFMAGEEWYGIEVDLARALARDLHRQISLKLYDPSSGMMALKTGMADVMLGGIFITPERQQEYLFAKPYHEFRPAFYVKDQAARAGLGSIRQFLKKSIENNLIKEDRWKYITSGLWKTIVITLLSILLGSILGIGICAMARSRRKWLRSTASFYNGFMAGIPMLVLLLILFYVVFAKSGLDPTAVAVVAFALNFASGASDVYGTSLDAVPQGQTEGGLALGFTRLQTFAYIVFPQALKRGIPLFQGQCISLLKGTSIVGYIAIQDLTRAGDMIRSRTFDAFVPLLLVTVVYFVLAWLLGLLIKIATPKTRAL